MLDLGCGESPYRRFFGGAGTYLRVDLNRAARPDVVARSEALPFRDGAFDGVLSTQLLQLTDDPVAMSAELSRVVRPGGRVWITVPAAYPFDAAASEHRFGAAELRGLFSGMTVLDVVQQGGMLALPWAVLNVTVREAVRAAERRAGAVALVLAVPAAIVYALSNACGRALETLAAKGPFAPFLGYLDARLPQNFLVVAERPS